MGPPELKVQGGSQTGQVKQRMQHLHGGASIHESWEEDHKLRCERRAVPSQELEQTWEAQPEKAEKVGVEESQVVCAEVYDLKGQGRAVEAFRRETSEQLPVDGFCVHGGRFP